MARKAEKLARSARIACEKWRTYFKWNIDNYHLMFEFVLGRQWEEEEEDMLVNNQKIPMTSNKLATMANSLLGEQQQNTPQLQVIPMSNCDQQTAEIRELILKDIVFSTPAKTVYQVAARQSFIGGFGGFLVDTEYKYEGSFEQDFVYRHFKDATRCYWDIGAEHINKIDGMVSGVISRMTRTKFRNVYGKKIEETILTESSITATQEEIALAVQPNVGDDPFSWADEESITILDHYVRKYKKETIYKLSNGKSVTKDELDEIIEQSKLMMSMQESAPSMDEPLEANDEEAIETDEKNEIAPELMTIFDEGEMVRIEESRVIKRSSIMHYKIAGDYVLDESEFPSEDLPVIFVDQNSYYDKDGKQMCRSFFNDVKDTQRYINYLRTQSAYILKISRYDQFIASKKNVQGLDTQRDWKDPQSVKGLLAYDESPLGYKPEQLRPPELSQSLLTQYQLAIEDLYTSTGLYPNRMGQEGNEVSGVAINARTRQGSYSTYVAFNSVNRAIEAGGIIVNQAIPKVYDTERVISLMSPSDGLKTVRVNEEKDAYGMQISNDIRKGTYQVRLMPGASYEGQKQEALESLQQVLQANPQTFNLVADLYAENLPLANNIQLKNRLKTMVPPQILEAGKTGKMPQENNQNQPSPEEMAVQMQQQKMQMDAQFKQQELQIRQQELQLKMKQQQIDLEIEMQKLEAEKLEVAGQIKEQELRYLAETQRTEQDAAIAHADNLVKILTHKI